MTTFEIHLDTAPVVICIVTINHHFFINAIGSLSHDTKHTI